MRDDFKETTYDEKDGAAHLSRQDKKEGVVVPDRGRDQRPGCTGVHDGDLQIGVGGAVGAQREALFACITGGILDQLISQARSQLEKAEESIAWYEEEKAEAQQQLEQLQKLKEMAEQVKQGVISTENGTHYQ